MTSEDAAAAGDDSDTSIGDRPTFDTSVAHQARMYDYMLGGKDNFAADRAAADAAIKAFPGMVITARANRAFLGRAVRYLAAEAGIRQFLDIGTGIPAAGNTHEIAQAAAPGSRIVYVDHDPVVLAHARALLVSNGEGATDYIDADLRDTGTILRQAARTLDFSRPVAVMLLSILHAIGDDDDPYRLVATLMDAVPPGSYLALSHMGSDILGPETGTELKSIGRQMGYQQYSYRSRAEVARFFDGLDLVEPGLVRVEQWRPAVGIGTASQTALWCGVARKP
ncbi:MAG TPA: SAM-dependent methyltransferase [Streptosporangiaceae bacterium]|nr:SAM-dependent methyltransferase [Streptosporangiaceae bacterium]